MRDPSRSGEPCEAGCDASESLPSDYSGRAGHLGPSGAEWENGQLKYGFPGSLTCQLYGGAGVFMSGGTVILTR